MLDIYENAVAPSSEENFCTTREKRLGMSLEEFSDRNESRLKAFRRKFEPVRSVLKETPYLARGEPLYGDCDFFGTRKHMELCSSLTIIIEDDPIIKMVREHELPF